MSADTIECDVEVEAPRDVVWALVTTPEHISEWFTDGTSLDARPGGTGRFSWTDKATNRSTTVNVHVEAVESPTYFAFRWDFPDGATPDATNALLVEFRLDDGDACTRVKVSESGLARVSRPDAVKERYYAEHVSGWPQILDRLRAYAAEQR